MESQHRDEADEFAWVFSLDGASLP
jgi:hypothetical protein